MLYFASRDFELGGGEGEILTIFRRGDGLGTQGSVGGWQT